MGCEWEKAFKEGCFSIETTKPSKIVIDGFKRLKLQRGFRVLDLGCGKNGRNSVYAACLGGIVDAVDWVEPNFMELSDETNRRISFHGMSVTDFDIKPETYDAVIATRLIQYLDAQDLRDLFGRIAEGLTREGLLMLSYTASGGIFNQPNIRVQKYQHNINEIKRMLQNNGLEIVSLEGGSGVATHVPYESQNEAYDILAKRKGGA